MNFVTDLPKNAEFLMAGKIRTTDTSIYVEMLARVDRNLCNKEQIAVLSGDHVEIYLVNE